MELKDFRFKIIDKNTGDSCVLGFEDLVCTDFGIYIRSIIEDENSNIPASLSGRMLLKDTEYSGGSGYKCTSSVEIEFVKKDDNV